MIVSDGQQSVVSEHAISFRMDYLVRRDERPSRTCLIERVLGAIPAAALQAAISGCCAEIALGEDEPGHLSGGYGPAQQVALNLREATRPEPGQLLLRLDALGGCGDL